MKLQLKPLPEAREALDIDATIEPAAFEKMCTGFLPRSAADKWLIIMDESWTMHIFRAPTRTCIFQVAFEPTADKKNVTIKEAWANRDPAQYRSTKAGYDAKLLIYLIRRLLLDHPVPFPTPGDLSADNQAAHERHVMGEPTDAPAVNENQLTTFIPLNLLELDPPPTAPTDLPKPPTSDKQI